jgi:hypothetical protein
MVRTTVAQRLEVRGWARRCASAAIAGNGTWSIVSTGQRVASYRKTS